MNLELNGENNRSKRDAFIKVTSETRATAGNFEYYLKIKERIKIDEFHLIFTDGSKVKVINENSVIKYINF